MALSERARRFLRRAVWPVPLAAQLAWPGTLHAALCEDAAARAEQAQNLPGGLLRAIGLVETSRRDRTGAVTAWPWSVGQASGGRAFESEPQAEAWAGELRSAGISSIDIGCFQVNLPSHPGAFSSLGDAFDPDTNARVAAAFLAGLSARLGSWQAAIAAYHSASPGLGLPYARRVLAVWRASDGQEVLPVPPEPALPRTLRVRWTGEVPRRPAGGLPRILRGTADAAP